MLTHSALVTLYLMYLGIHGEWAGSLLWPAIVLHVVITILLVRAWLINPKTSGRNWQASEQ
jgi:hypothetical protein